MKKKIFAIMGATGNIGQVIVEDLLKRGHTVRALGRDSKKLLQLEHKGAIPITLKFDDVDALTNAFKDAYAVFSFIPPGYRETSYSAFQDRVSEAIVKAIQNSGVRRVVNLSSVGANLAEGTGPVKGLYRHEKRLDNLKNLISLIQLRPHYFMENLNGFLPSMQNQRVIRSSQKADLSIPMVATRDIGWKAADFLDSSAPLPHLIFDFVGPKEVNMQQVCEVFAKAFDLPGLQYVEIASEDEQKALLAAGMPPEMVNLMIEMYKGFNTGLITTTQELKQSHQGTTTIEEYAQMLAHKAFALERK